MARRAIWARRSRIEWSIRIALAVIAVVIGYDSVTRSLAFTVRKQNPALAHALAPGDGQIAAEYAVKIASNPKATPEERQRADDLATLALRQDPSAVAAVRSLGVNRQVDGNLVSARRLFGYAERLSRRDLQVQIWAVGDAAVRGDVVGALTHADIALRTARTAPDVLFPILSAAIVDPAVRRGLVDVLSRSPAWGEAFLNDVARRKADPRSVVALLSASHRRSIAVPAEADAAIINNLVAAGAYKEAWEYYALIRPQSDRRRSRDPRFSATLATPSLLDWTLFNDGNVTSSIQRTDEGNVLEFVAPPSVGGPILRQMQLLPPGEYRLSGYSDGIEQTASSLPYWTLTCYPEGRELGRVDVPNSAQAAGAFGGTFRIPADCAVQSLMLVARPSGTMLGLTGQLKSVELVPAK